MPLRHIQDQCGSPAYSDWASVKCFDRSGNPVYMPPAETFGKGERGGQHGHASHTSQEREDRERTPRGQGGPCGLCLRLDDPLIRLPVRPFLHQRTSQTRNRAFQQSAPLFGTKRNSDPGSARGRAAIPPPASLQPGIVQGCFAMVEWPNGIYCATYTQAYQCHAYALG